MLLFLFLFAVLRPWIGLFDESNSSQYSVLLFRSKPYNVLLFPTGLGNRNYS